MLPRPLSFYVSQNSISTQFIRTSSKTLRIFFFNIGIIERKIRVNSFNVYHQLSKALQLLPVLLLPLFNRNTEMVPENTEMVP